MKEFEKWDDNDNCNTPNEVCELVRECSACTQLKKEGWRAALEWMKSKLECEIQPGDVEYFIDKELGDT